MFFNVHFVAANQTIQTECEAALLDIDTQINKVFIKLFSEILISINLGL